MRKKLFQKTIIFLVLVSILITNLSFAKNYDSKTKTYYYKAKLVDYPIYVDGSIENTEFLKLNVDGTTYLSIRDLARMLRVEISWNENEKSINIGETLKEYNYEYSISNYYNEFVKATEVKFPIYVYGDRKYPEKLELVVNGTTYLSIRDLANMLEISITWDKNSRSINIQKEKKLSDANSDIAYEMLKLVNEYRAENGKKPLELMIEKDIQEYANLRAREIVEKFSHTRPNGENFNDYPALKNSYYPGENIAAGLENAKDAVEALKKSSAHRENMLNDKYTHMYAAQYYKENSEYGTYFVQIFGIKK